MNRIFTLLVFGLLTFFSGCSNSSGKRVIEQEPSKALKTQSMYLENCSKLSNMFLSIYEVSKLSVNQATIKPKHAPSASKQILKKGTTIQGDLGHHSKVEYTFKTVKNNEANFEFTAKFDARSFGGKVRTCSGKFSTKI